MIIDCAHYRDGRRQDVGPVPVEEAAARRTEGGFVWLGMFEPDRRRTGPGARQLRPARAGRRGRADVPHAAQGRALRRRRRSWYPAHRPLRRRRPRRSTSARSACSSSPTFVITVRQGVASELRGARARLEQRPELLDIGSAAVLWAILDQVVDGYAPVVAELERDIDQIEATVFSGAVAPTERIYSLRREATDFYRAVHPLLAVVATVERDGRRRPARPTSATCTTTSLLVNEEVAAQRDLLGTVLEANMAVISVRADQGQRPAERHDRAADDPGHGVPAADLRHRVLRPELRLAGQQHRRPRRHSSFSGSAA